MCKFSVKEILSKSNTQTAQVSPTVKIKMFIQKFSVKLFSINILLIGLLLTVFAAGCGEKWGSGYFDSPDNWRYRLKIRALSLLILLALPFLIYFIYKLQQWFVDNVILSLIDWNYVRKLKNKYKKYPDNKATITALLDETYSNAAIKVIGKLGLSAGKTYLFKEAVSEDPDTRHAVRNSLRKLNGSDKELIRHYFIELTKEKNKPLSFMILVTLSCVLDKIPSDKKNIWLQEFLDEPDIRLLVAEGLGTLYIPEALDKIKQLMQQYDEKTDEYTVLSKAARHIEQTKKRLDSIPKTSSRIEPLSDNKNKRSVVRGIRYVLIIIIAIILVTTLFFWILIHFFSPEK